MSRQLRDTTLAADRCLLLCLSSAGFVSTAGLLRFGPQAPADPRDFRSLHPNCPAGRLAVQRVSASRCDVCIDDVRVSWSSWYLAGKHESQDGCCYIDVSRRNDSSFSFHFYPNGPRLEGVALGRWDLPSASGLPNPDLPITPDWNRYFCGLLRRRRRGIPVDSGQWFPLMVLEELGHGQHVFVSVVCRNGPWLRFRVLLGFSEISSSRMPSVVAFSPPLG